jgi:hypothetical protein
LEVFWEAMSHFAHMINSASWDEEFAEEAERIFQERASFQMRFEVRGVRAKSEF